MWHSKQLCLLAFWKTLSRKRNIDKLKSDALVQELRIQAWIQQGARVVSTPSSLFSPPARQ